MYPTVNVVYANAKKPDPRVCSAGALTKRETSRNVHQMKLTARNAVERPRRARTLQRL
jgi:hypothetical protein